MRTLNPRSHAQLAVRHVPRPKFRTLLGLNKLHIAFFFSSLKFGGCTFGGVVLYLLTQGLKIPCGPQRRWPGTPGSGPKRSISGPSKELVNGSGGLSKQVKNPHNPYSNPAHPFPPKGARIQMLGL